MKKRNRPVRWRETEKKRVAVVASLRDLETEYFLAEAVAEVTTASGEAVTGYGSKRKKFLPSQRSVAEKDKVIASADTFMISARDNLMVDCEVGTARSSFVTPDKEKEEEKHPYTPTE
jgi:hypothetical protein